MPDRTGLCGEEAARTRGAREGPLAEPVVLINVFSVPADETERFIERWKENGAVMARAAGLLDFRLHWSLDPDARFQFVNVARWASREAWEAATASPEFRASIRAMQSDPSIHPEPNPALYRVIAEHGPGGPAQGGRA